MTFECIELWRLYNFSIGKKIFILADLRVVKLVKVRAFHGFYRACVVYCGVISEFAPRADQFSLTNSTCGICLCFIVFVYVFELRLLIASHTHTLTPKTQCFCSWEYSRLSISAYTSCFAISWIWGFLLL